MHVLLHATHTCRRLASRMGRARNSGSTGVDRYRLPSAMTALPTNQERKRSLYLLTSCRCPLMRIY